MSQYADKTLTCRDCGQEFTFTVGEQEFYAQRGFSEPTRCAGCRAARKAGRESGTIENGGGRARGSYSATESGYGRSGEGYGAGGRGATRQMFKTTCADCGAATEVPFEPRQGRPVYCRDCFEKRNPRR